MEDLQGSLELRDLLTVTYQGSAHDYIWDAACLPHLVKETLGMGPLLTGGEFADSSKAISANLTATASITAATALGRTINRVAVDPSGPHSPKRT